MSIHPSILFFDVFKVSSRLQHTAPPEHFNNSCLDLFLKLSFLVLLFKPLLGKVTEWGLKNEGSSSFLAALPRAQATVLEHDLGGGVGNLSQLS